MHHGPPGVSIGLAIGEREGPLWPSEDSLPFTQLQLFETNLPRLHLDLRLSSGNGTLEDLTVVGVTVSYK
jgi:hypothetical protein